MPQQIARCGYVVVVPDLGTTDPYGDSHVNLAASVVEWMREVWQHGKQLAPATALIGHSYGGILACRVAIQVAASTYVSLSAPWAETLQQFTSHPLDELDAPSLFMWGTGEPNDASLEGGNIELFKKVKGTKHTIVFEGALHFDYLPPDIQLQCGDVGRGPCDLVGQLATDFAALFLTRYMPPPQAFILVAPSLEIPTVGELTLQQEFYAGSHLVGITNLQSGQGCQVTHKWFLEGGETGTLTLP